MYNQALIPSQIWQYLLILNAVLTTTQTM